MCVCTRACACTCIPVAGLHEKRLLWTAGLEVNLPAMCAVREQGRCPVLRQSQQQLHRKVHCNLGQEGIARTSAVTFFLAPHLSTWRPQACGISPHSFLLLVGRGTPLQWWVWEAACLQGECVLVCSQPCLGSLSCWEPAVSRGPRPPCARWVSLISG